MPKRIIAAIIGALAVVSGNSCVWLHLEVARDFGNPEVSFWPNVLGTAFMGTIALGGSNTWDAISALCFVGKSL